MDLSSYVPGPAQLLELILATATVFAFVAIGAAASGHRRDHLFDAFTGFGLVTGFMTVLGTMSAVPFSWMAVAVWIAALIAALFVFRRDVGAPWAIPSFGLQARVLTLSLPILLPVSAMQASQWDEFSQWLLNSLFIFKFDAFPQLSLPISPSIFPAYPHGTSLFAYLVSWANDGFVEMAVAIGNVLLLLFLAPVYLAMVRFGLGDKAGPLSGWTAAAIGILGVTVLSTTFVQKLVFTAYADTSTAVFMAVLGILVWRLLNELADRTGQHMTLAWQFALSCMLFINLKQTNLVLLIFLLGTAALVAVRDPNIRVSDFFKTLLVMLALPLVVYVSWRLHISTHLDGREFSLRPIETWLIDDSFAIFSRMVKVAAGKGAYFCMMMTIAAAGLWCFFTGRGGKYGRLLFITGAVFLIYFAFLWSMYVTAFTEYEGVRAASFWRYNTQLGLLGALTAAVAGARVYGQWVMPVMDRRTSSARVLGASLIIAVVATPVLFNQKIRFDLRPQKEHMRMVGKELAHIIPSDGALALFDPNGDGLADLVIKYEVKGFSRFDPSPRFVTLLLRDATAHDEISNLLDGAGITHLWVHQVAPEIVQSLGIEQLRNDGSTLVIRDKSSAWRIERSWPYDGYTDPYTLPD